MATSVKRYKPKSEVRDKCDPASESTYLMLADKALKAVLERRWDMYLALPYFVSFKVGFPKGIIHNRTNEANIYKVKTRKLLDWLHKNGYSAFDTAAVMAATTQMERRVAAVDRMLNGELAKVAKTSYTNEGEENDNLG